MDGKFIYQPEIFKAIDGKIKFYAMLPTHIGDKISKGDIIILGDRKDAQSRCSGQICQSDNCHRWL
ncbi:hypothetical protein [Peptoniphilus sp.]|uniref:hypothetical protein n=1 Tax=Peptoniphilus sp. TaxID=1971214 RepID=UPI002A75ED7C|nr:hypothetical protein [Peptoniphilus sp.]